MVTTSNEKVIVVNGFARGGTNVLWNIYQSHPEVCSPIYETGEIFFNKKNKVLRPLYLNKITLKDPMFSILGKKVDKTFFEYKRKNYFDEDNRYKNETITYTESEINNTTLCIKSLNEDVFLTEFLNKLYDNIFFVGQIRNGYALCEGWKRRGRSAKDIGKLYRKVGEKMIEDSQKYTNYTVVKFEDILKTPFSQAENLYSFAQLSPESLEKLRFKSKKTLSKDGTHSNRFGDENRKYWFDKNNIEAILDPNISETQASNLSSKDKKDFEREAKPVLDFFNYN